MGILPNPKGIIAAALAGAAAIAALGQSPPVLTGAAAYGDWRSDAPGVRRRITPADMPPPYETASAHHGPTVVERPANTWPKAPPGFVVELFAGGLDNPRAVRVAPNGDIFVAESGPGRIRVLRAAAGGKPAEVGAEHLTNVWAPIFSDLLLHHMPVINGERVTTDGLPRDVVAISRLATNAPTKGDDGAEDEDREDNRGRTKGRVFDTFDLERNLADDTFSNSKASAEGSEFRTAPLMGLGRIGAPFLHDGRVYLSRDTVQSTPAGTVTTNRELTNAPLVVRSLDDALLAAIELHDLPPPDDKKTPNTPGAGCPVPEQTTNVTETAADICPAYSSTTSQTNRSDAREVIRRFRELSSDDQQAVIEFLKQL